MSTQITVRYSYRPFRGIYLIALYLVLYHYWGIWSDVVAFAILFDAKINPKV